MRKVGRSILAIFALLFLKTVTLAHEDREHIQSIFNNIELSQLMTLAVLLFSVSIYVLGIARLWHVAGRGRGISVRSAASFFAGWLSLSVALIGPFHRLSEALFSAHMTQHEILMLISAPLIVLGRPQVAAIWALSQRWKMSVAVVVNNDQFTNAWRFISGSFAAFLFHAAALWIWHIPALFDATLESDWVHALQHVSFFGTALLFWWAIVTNSLDWKNSFVGVLFLFLTSLHSGILGAFLTFTRQIWYPVYSGTTAAYRLTPLEDQQLGGLIMWVPAGLIYLCAGLIMFARLLRQTEKRAISFDSRLLVSRDTTNL